jgi:hypothetical protein
MRHSLLSALVAATLIAPAPQARFVITEVMSSSGSTPDWFELTNDGSSAVSLTGWKMDDGSFNLAAAVALSGITSIGAGESVIFIESAGGTGIASFRSFWGGLANVQVGYYSGSGVGLSSGGDGVCVFNNLGVNVNQVSFGAATTGSSFFWGWDAQGSIDPNYSAVPVLRRMVSAGQLGRKSGRGFYDYAKK